MQFRNKALAGIVLSIALAGCASQERKQTTTSSTDQQAKAQLAKDQQMAYMNNLACKNQQKAGVADESQKKDNNICSCACLTQPCNCSCSAPKEAQPQS